MRFNHMLLGEKRDTASGYASSSRNAMLTHMLPSIGSMVIGALLDLPLLLLKSPSVSQLRRKAVDIIATEQNTKAKLQHLSQPLGGALAR